MTKIDDVATLAAIRAQRHMDDGPETCGSTYITNDHDSYSTECGLAPGHSGRHRGLNPFGGEGCVEWWGGVAVGGDRLPYCDVRWVR
jgi:hypothetical protein